VVPGDSSVNPACFETEVRVVRFPLERLVRIRAQGKYAPPHARPKDQRLSRSTTSGPQRRDRHAMEGVLFVEQSAVRPSRSQSFWRLCQTHDVERLAWFVVTASFS